MMYAVSEINPPIVKNMHYLLVKAYLDLKLKDK